MQALQRRIPALSTGVAIVGALVVSGLAHAASVSAQPADPSWQTYHSARGAFSIAVPASWTVQETAEAGGTLVRAVASTEGDGGVAVRVGANDELPADLPNTLCGPIAVGSLSATRCVDTLSRGVSVTLTGPAETYTISTSRLLDPAVFERILASFALDVPLDTSTGAADEGSLAPPPAPPAVDRCVMWLGPSKARPLCPPP